MSPTSGTPSGGEPIDRTAGEAIRLAHRALDRFPEVVRRHKFVAGGAVISSSLIALAGVAITRRIRAGQTPERPADMSKGQWADLHMEDFDP